MDNRRLAPDEREPTEDTIVAAERGTAPPNRMLRAATSWRQEAERNAGNAARYYRIAADNYARIGREKVAKQMIDNARTIERML